MVPARPNVFTKRHGRADRLVLQGALVKGHNVVFLQTDEAVALYGYIDAFKDLEPL